jgi:hypothetical protein
MTGEAVGFECVVGVSFNSHFWRRCSIVWKVAWCCQPLMIDITARGSSTSNLSMSLRTVLVVKVSRLICRPCVAVLTLERVNCLANWSHWTMVMRMAIGFRIWWSSIVRAQHARDGSGNSPLPIKTM